MLPNIDAGLTVREFEDGATVDCTTGVLEELRRLAVEGLIAFGHGGLEIGGVLYGVRDGDRLSIRASAELPCEHALGPGFALSDTDREAFGRLLRAPAGLECVGWYRSHTRSGLDLDASDRDMFERFFADERSAGLVLKPTHWGPSAAALYARRTDGEILTSSPDFTIGPLDKKPGEAEEPVCVECPPDSAGEPASPLAAASAAASVVETTALPPGSRARRQAGAVFLLAAAILAICYLGWPRPARKLALQAYATSPGQVRIEWNHNSQPVVNARSGRLQIEDGNSERTIALDRNQLRFSSIVYVQKSSHITVILRIEPRDRAAAAAEESVEFVGRVEPPAPTAYADSAPSSQAPPEPKLEKRSRVVADGHPPAPAKRPAAPVASPARKKKFYLSLPPLTATADRIGNLPEAPPVPAATNVLPSLPGILSSAQPPFKSVSQSTAQPYTGPRSGRLIWTGELGRRGVIEIEGQHASIGSLSGTLSTGPAEYRALPAEFTRDGLAVYTTEGGANGRAEAPSKGNGWNSVHFIFDPVRAGELVVLEQPSRINHFSRLVLRNNARNCQVVLVEWTVRPELRN